MPAARAYIPPEAWPLIFAMTPLAIGLAAMGIFSQLPGRVPAIATYLMVLGANLLWVMATTGLLIAVPALNLDTGTPWFLACLLLLVGLLAMGVVAFCYRPTRLIGLSLVSIGLVFPVSLAITSLPFIQERFWLSQRLWLLLPGLAWMALGLGLIFSRSPRPRRKLLGWSVIPFVILAFLVMASYLIPARFPGFAAQSRAAALLEITLPQEATNLEVIYKQFLLYQGEVSFDAPSTAVQTWFASGVACFDPNWLMAPGSGGSISLVQNSCFDDGWYYIEIAPGEPGLWSVVVGRGSD
jgi:hypothetical protein